MVEKLGNGNIKLSGRVDTNNAAEVGEKLIACCTRGEEVVIDASELSYISSAGLRSLLRLKKEIKTEVNVINVTHEIYDIFEVTGFTDILNVSQKLREISVDESNIIGEGANGKVFRLNDDTIIKVFAPGTPMEVVRQERDFARAAFVSGVPTAIPYDVAKVADSYGAVYEMLDARTLSNVIDEDPGRAEEMGERMGTLLSELHHTPANKEKLTNMLETYKSRVEYMSRYYTDKETAKLMSVYDALDERDTMLHGDYHPKNIMYMDDELIFIDMGDVGYGHPMLDLGGSFLGMVNVGRINPKMVKHYIGMEYDVVLRVWDRMTKVYFGEDGVENGRRLAEIYGMAKYALTPTIYTKMTEEMIAGFVERMRTGGILSEEFDVSDLKY